MHARVSGAVCAVMLLPVVAAAGAQVRREPGRTAVELSLDLNAGGEVMKGTGTGACTHAPRASIYGVTSQLRTARLADGPKSIQITLWDPLDGSDDMFTVAFGSGDAAGTVSRVRGGTTAGSGTVTFEPSGKGGTFRIDAKTADGRAVSGTVTCSAFTPHVAEGG